MMPDSVRRTVLSSHRIWRPVNRPPCQTKRLPLDPLHQAVGDSITRLADSIRLLNGEQYRKPCRNLGDAFIGQHVRHVIEMFQCLDRGYETGCVDYESRRRDPDMESDPAVALRMLDGIMKGLDRPDRALLLVGSYSETGDEPIRIDTNYRREVAYNLEHTIHHMALIRVGLREVSDVEVPEGYGVASATVKHRRECAR